MSQLDLTEFAKKHQLGSEYIGQAVDFFAPLARELVNLHQDINKPIIVGINGAQGSGKSTLSDLLLEIFSQKYDLHAVTLSLDDFYYTHSERQHLAHNVHPLLATRGVPGTHDIMLANDTLDALLSHNGAQVVSVPRFNKATDDRFEDEHWTDVTQKPAIIIFEGWCVGACHQATEALQAPTNILEAEEDKQGIWRTYVNDQLALLYEPLFQRLDCTVMLKAPSFECVFNWRLEQEDKLIQTLGNHSDPHGRTMNPNEIARFIQHYQRITEHLLKTLPLNADYVFTLDSKRHIEKRQKRNGFNNLSHPTLIFTDLDGSLLDHHSYSHTPADSTLTYLTQNAIPVIPCSSKTQSEIEHLRSELHNSHPFISENGAAVYIPKGYFARQPNDTTELNQYWVKSFVQPYEYWLEKLQNMKEDFFGLYRGFHDMTIEEIAELTDLSLEQASLAAKREYGEPVLWLGDDNQKTAFVAQLKEQGVNVLQGGRFIHICGDADKGKALLWLASVYQQMHGKTYTTIAIGDSHNDREMLDIADHALVIRSPSHGIPSLNRVRNITISEKTGPLGWAQGVQRILDEIFTY